MKLRIASLKGKWHDPDEVLLHAAFVCVENYVAECGGEFRWVDACPDDSLAEKESIARQNVQTEEIKCLHDWWQMRKLCQSYPSDPIQWDEDTAMLQRLIMVRGMLWT